MNTEQLVYQLLKDAANKWPGNPAVYDEYGTISFAQLYNQTETLRLHLIDLGIKPGMGVAMKAGKASIKKTRNRGYTGRFPVACGA